KVFSKIARPAGVGLMVPVLPVLSETDWRARLPANDMKNQALSCLIGPPKVAPKRFCTNLGSTGLVQPVATGSWPWRQKPNSGFFSWLANESVKLPLYAS